MENVRRASDHVDCIFDGSSKHVDLFGKNKDMVCDIGEIDSCCGRNFRPTRFVVAFYRLGLGNRRGCWSTRSVLTKVSGSFGWGTVVSECVDHVV